MRARPTPPAASAPESGPVAPAPAAAPVGPQDSAPRESAASRQSHAEHIQPFQLTPEKFKQGNLQEAALRHPGALAGWGQAGLPHGAVRPASDPLPRPPLGPSLVLESLQTAYAW